MSEFQQIKLMIVSGLGIAKDGVHIYIGVAAYLFVVLVLRRAAGSFVSLVPVLVLALGAEAFDLLEGAPVSASIHDLWNTMLTPCVLVFLARRGVFCAGRCSEQVPSPSHD